MTSEPLGTLTAIISETRHWNEALYFSRAAVKIIPCVSPWDQCFPAQFTALQIFCVTRWCWFGVAWQRLMSSWSRLVFSVMIFFIQHSFSIVLRTREGVELWRVPFYRQRQVCHEAHRPEPDGVTSLPMRSMFFWTWGTHCRRIANSSGMVVLGSKRTSLHCGSPGSKKENSGGGRTEGTEVVLLEGDSPDSLMLFSHMSVCVCVCVCDTAAQTYINFLRRTVHSS